MVPKNSLLSQTHLNMVLKAKVSLPNNHHNNSHHKVLAIWVGIIDKDVEVFFKMISFHKSRSLWLQPTIPTAPGYSCKRRWVSSTRSRLRPYAAESKHDARTGSWSLSPIPKSNGPLFSRDLTPATLWRSAQRTASVSQSSSGNSFS
jgi:hypothetical protein